MKKLLILLFLPVIFGGCEQSSDCCVYPVTDNALLPLAVGNSWELQRKSESGEQSPDVTLTNTVDAQVTLNGTSYFRMIVVTEMPDVTAKDTVYYRIDDHGFVFVRENHSSSELNELRLLAQPGDTWPYREGDMKLTKIDKVFLSAQTLENCKYYYYDVPETADEELLIVLSPAVGFVRIINGMGIFELKKAVIAGKTRDY